MDDLKAVIREIKNICREEDIIPDDNLILDCSVRIFISSNISKDRQQSSYKPQTQQKQQLSPQSANEPATDKQRALLEKMHYNGDIDALTKAEARQLIKEQLERKQMII